MAVTMGARPTQTDPLVGLPEIDFGQFVLVHQFHEPAYFSHVEYVVDFTGVWFAVVSHGRVLVVSRHVHRRTATAAHGPAVYPPRGGVTRPDLRGLREVRKGAGRRQSPEGPGRRTPSGG